MTYSKNDITFHSEYFGEAHAAVNVKVQGWIGNVRHVNGVPAWHDGPWCGNHYSESQLLGAYEVVCHTGWEIGETLAQAIFGRSHSLYRRIERWSVQSEGRSAGWLVVTYDGKPVFDVNEVQSWSAIELMRWAQFERDCRKEVDRIPEEAVDFLYSNVYPKIDRQCGDVGCPCSLLLTAVRR